MKQIEEKLLSDAISVINDLLNSVMMDVILANDGRDAGKVYGGEIAILNELRELLDKPDQHLPGFKEPARG